MRAVFLAAVASVGLAGCLGPVDAPTREDEDYVDPPDPGNAARQLYETNVYPILSKQCMGCHMSTGPVGNVTGFVTPTITNAYLTITNFTSVVGNYTPVTAGVLLKISGGHPPGAAPIVYTSDETTKITDWLNQEVAQQTGSPSTAPQTAADATQRRMAEWSACMSQTNFDLATMASAWGNMTATNNQKCSACHASGAQGFIATQLSTQMFDVVSTNKFYMLQYFTVTGLDNPATAMMAINTAPFVAVSGGLIPHRDHPRFNPLTNNGMTALQSFYDLTMKAVTDSATTPCGPPKLIN